MKGAFELFLTFLFGIVFVLLGFSMVETTFRYNHARLYQESIVSLIERHDRFDSDVALLINNLSNKCQGCSYNVTLEDSEYLVEVNFKVKFNVINYTTNASIKTYTQRLVQLWVFY